MRSIEPRNFTIVSFDVMQEAWERANRCFQEGLNTAVDFHPKLDKLSDGDYEAYLKSATVLSDGQRHVGTGW